ncbi:PPR repeat [Musa troglodytarum]|uniref:PPR repeat n=1 Tax=Musa troglodytarum TaxID=320322 RepID=A0A9E7I8G0_9LILI|nr:PPR repeat [Musa troglodytarum]
MSLSFRLRLFVRRFSSSTAATVVGPSPDPNPRSYTEPLAVTIGKLSKERDPDKLAAGFIHASASYRFRCRHRIYEIAVRRLKKAGRLDAVEAILEAQKRFPSDLAREGFAVRLISLYGKASMVTHAVTTFRQLPALGTPRSVMSFNALLTAFADSGDVEGLVAAFRDIPAADPTIIPNLISYNVLIRALCEKGDLDAALGTVDLMERNGISPDLIACNTLLHWSYERKESSEAEKIWALMRKKNIEPNTKSFNTKLRWLVSEGRTAEAAKLVDQLNHVGLQPDAFSFNALIKGYCQEGNLEEAKRLFSDFSKNQCAPNKGTFEIIIPYLCEAGELDLALKCCYDSMSTRCFVEAAVFQRVVNGLAKSSRMDEATKLVDVGRKNNYSRKSLRNPSSNLSLIV